MRPHVSLEQRRSVERLAAHLARQQGAFAAERSRFHRSRVARDHVHVVVQRRRVSGQRVGRRRFAGQRLALVRVQSAGRGRRGRRGRRAERAGQQRHGQVQRGICNERGD